MTQVPPILIISCDKYADLWKPFFSLFFKRWPDCPSKVFLGTNYRVFEDQRVASLPVGDDISWASGLLKMLDRIHSGYVILFLEDFLIKKPVDSERIQNLVSSAIEKKVGCLRFAAGLPLAFPPTEPVAGIEGVGTIGKNEPYRVSAQAALWRTETLKKLLIPGMNAWEFEEIGTLLSMKIVEPFWAVYEPAVVYSQCVEKGKWKPEGLEICREAGVPVDLEVRAVYAVDEFECYLSESNKRYRVSMRRQAAIKNFISGHIIMGLKAILSCIGSSPFDVRLWGVLIAGLCCPSFFQLYGRLKLRRSLDGIRYRMNDGAVTG